MTAWLRRRSLPLVLAAAAALYLLRLGAADLRAWDEALYALRVLDVLQRGHWLDQTGGAMGGLWTAAHPPLAIWSMALGALIGGLDEWTLRLPSALSGLATVAVLHRLAGRLDRRGDLGGYAALALLLVPWFTHYVRWGQLDAPVVFWTTLSVALIWHGLAGARRGFVAAGVACGLGLLSKLAVAAFAPLALGLFLLWELAAGPRRAQAVRDVRWLLLVGVTALAVGGWWFVAMTVTHGREYWHHALDYHVLRRMSEPLEGHASALGPLYYVHHLVIDLGPLAPLTLLGCVESTRRGNLTARARRFLWSWLLVPLAVFSIASTKLEIYLLTLLPAVSVFTGLGLRRLLARPAGAGPAGWVAPLVLAAAVWSTSHPLQRQVVALAESGLRAGGAREPVLVLGGFVAAAALLVGIGGWLWRRTGPVGRRRWQHLTAAAGLGAAGVLAIGPVFSGTVVWQPVQERLRELAPDRITCLGPSDAVAQYYLRSVGHLVAADRGGPRERPWRIVPAARWPEPSAPAPPPRVAATRPPYGPDPGLPPPAAGAPPPPREAFVVVGDPPPGSPSFPLVPDLRSGDLTLFVPPP